MSADTNMSEQNAATTTTAGLSSVYEDTMWPLGIKYASVGLAFGVIHAGIVLFCRRHRAKTEEDGLFWIPEFQRSKISQMIGATFILAQVSCVIIPVFIFLINVVMAIPLALSEGWAIRVGWYTVMNYGGILTYSVGVSPTTTSGQAVAVIISLFVFMIGNTILGIVSQLKFVDMITHAMPSGVLGLLLSVFLLFPLVCLLLCLCIGVVFTIAEGWDFTESFLCSIDLLGTGGNIGFCPGGPPGTGIGLFTLMLGNLLLLAISGTVVGITSTHEVILRIVCLIEGLPQCSKSVWSNALDKTTPDVEERASDAQLMERDLETRLRDAEARALDAESKLQLAAVEVRDATARALAAEMAVNDAARQQAERPVVREYV